MRILLFLDVPERENDYVRALGAAGVSAGEMGFPPGDPEAVLEAVRSASGVLLGGGCDVEPVRYSESARFGNLECDASRDAREFAAYDEARRLSLPLFAICRGEQLVNVARGGSLFQDLPSEHPSEVPHHRLPKDAECHEVLVDGGAAGEELRRAFGATTFRVNSRHHQAARRIAPDLAVAALSEDGLVEALAESTPSHDFFLAVQWHPENLAHLGGGNAELFGAFVRACRERAARPEGGRAVADAEPAAASGASR